MTRSKMAARNFQLGETIAEIKDIGPSVMALDCLGSVVLLASKRILQFIDLQRPDIRPKTARKGFISNWEVSIAAQWNPHESDATTFAVTRNEVAEIFNLVNGKAELKLTLNSHTRSIKDLDWSPAKAENILTCSADSYVFLWDIRNSKAPAKIFETSVSSSVSQVKWNKVEEHIFATSHDRDIRVWDTRRNDRPLCISGHLKKICCLDWSSHNSRLLASASEDETVKFWDYLLDTSQKLGVGELKNNNNAPIRKASFTPFEHGLLTIDVSHMRRDDSNSVRLWNIEDLNSPVHQYSFVGHTDVVTEFQWLRSKTTDNYSLVTWSRDDNLKIWKYETSNKSANSMTDPTIIADNAYKDQTGMNGIHINNNINNQYRHKYKADTSLTDEDEDSEDMFIKQPSPAKPQHRRESKTKLLLPSTDLFTLPEVADDYDNVSAVSADHSVTTAAAAAYLTDTNDDDDDEYFENVPISPGARSDTLEKEIRFLSDIRDVIVNADLQHRKLLVCINVKGEHKIRLLMDFPPNYPQGESPTFRFEANTSLDKAVQTRLITELENTAEPLISTNKACIEKCIRKLKSDVEELEMKRSLDSDAHFKSYNTVSSPYHTLANVPYPRTCGAHFCNDKLVTFQRLVHAAQSTPRYLSDGSSGLSTPSASRSRTFLSMLSRSPKDSHPSFYNKTKPKSRAMKKERGGHVNIYCVEDLLPYSKEMALTYKMEPTSASCRHNADVAANGGRRDMHQIWLLIAELIDEHKVDDNDSSQADNDKLSFRKPYAQMPFGRSMIITIMDHYANIGDFQSLSMLACMFPFTAPIPVINTDLDNSRFISLQHQIQRSSSNLRILGTSPATSLSGRSPPDKHNNYFYHHTIHSSDRLSKEWKQLLRKSALRRRENSYQGSLQDIRNSYPSADNAEVELQKEKNSLMLLDPNQAQLYDYYKEQYADILYRWSLIKERALLLKSLSIQPDQTSASITMTCGKCSAECTGFKCACSRVASLQCALCRNGVKGPSTICLKCGHGGHLDHMRTWFSSHSECATSCGCHCLDFNASEISVIGDDGHT